MTRRAPTYLPALLAAAAGGGVAVAMTSAAGEIYESLKEADGLSLLDHPVLDTMVSIRTPPLTELARGLAFLGGGVGMSMLCVAVTSLLAWRRRAWTPLLLMAGATAGSLLMTIVGKELVGRARPPLARALPPQELTPSFPSGHTLNATVIAGVVAYLLVLRQRMRRRQAATVALAAAFAVVMGVSRIYLGAHWFTDVACAWALGLAWLAVVAAAHQLWTVLRIRRG